MKTELLMIGTELLLGQIQDTNSTWISQVLAEHGIDCFQKTTVGDNRARILGALDAGLTRSDVILCSGGLGPTEDDITRESIAALLDRPLVFRPELYGAILERFAVLQRAPTENNKKQAALPEGAIPIENPHGTAPGLIVEDPRGIIICMPGVPHELKPMLVERVLPWLKKRFGIGGVLYSRVLKVCGVGESRIDAEIGDLMNAHSNPTIGLLASPEFVRIRLTAKAPTENEARALIEPVARAVYDRLPGQIMGEGDDTLEEKTAGLLRDRGHTISVIETFTGGMIAQRLLLADPARVTEGVILGPGSREYNTENFVDLGRNHMLRSGAIAALVCTYSAVDATARVFFITPGEHTTWDLPVAGSGIRAQVRLTVSILEQLRRHLILQ
ncbi:MAG: CinA family nicotinamide mononucleotide deamidase-related protein [Candidatus Hydrogenedentes bacterium]|nr:CinA family nicotinamide mononucleotide deamidase-related protein [Candidatus Hydrogenedentota bacterium]